VALRYKVSNVSMVLEVGRQRRRTACSFCDVMDSLVSHSFQRVYSATTYPTAMFNYCNTLDRVHYDPVDERSKDGVSR